MIPLDIRPDLDVAPFADLKDTCPTLGAIERIGRLRKGTTAGKSVVAIVVLMPDGTRHMAQTTLALLQSAMTVFQTREDMDKAGGN